MTATAYAPALERARGFLAAAIAEALPPRKLTVSEWADAYRVLSRESSAEPGPWVTDRAPYQREMMNAVLDPDVEQVCFYTARQVGKTDLLNNVLGYYIAEDPAPILVVMPTVELAESWSKDRLAPMIRDSAALRACVHEAKSRDSDNTILHKVFPGGRLTGVGANAPAGLASRPIRIVLCDEVDRFPASAGSEGDPIELAIGRTDTFWNRKVLLTSTPTVKGLSRIEIAWDESDQRRYYVPCPYCHHTQVLNWEPTETKPGGIVWERDADGHAIVETAAYQCEECKRRIPEQEKWNMLRGGEWVATFPGRAVRGYGISALYSPWKRWAELVALWVKVHKNSERLKVFVNTMLGETWEEEGETIGPELLRGRLEHYKAEVPSGAGVLVAAVDTQADRLEVVVKAYGAGEESWLIHHHVLPGDPGHQKVWDELDGFLRRRFVHESGQQLTLDCTVIDSGGLHTEQVYRFTKVRSKRRIFSIKGMAGARELVGRPSFSERHHTKLYMVGVDTGKDMVWSRLRARIPGPGFMHLPIDRVDEEYLEQLTAERPVRKWVKGRGWRREWVKVREHNEAWDLEVYALAALNILGPILMRSLHERAQAWDKKVDPPTTPKGGEGGEGGTGGSGGAGVGRRRRRAGGGWVQGWAR